MADIKISQLIPVSKLALEDIFAMVKIKGTNNAPETSHATLGKLIDAFGKKIVVDLYGATASNVSGQAAIDESAAINAALKAAYDTQYADIEIPNVGTGTYLLKAPLLLSGNEGQYPYITAVDPTNDIVTFNKAHSKNTGDPIMFQGYQIAGLPIETQIFCRKEAADKLSFYTTQASAKTGGSTNKVNITGNCTTQGSISLNSTTLTVQSSQNVEVGTSVMINGGAVVNSNGGFFVIGGVGTLSLTLNAPADRNAPSVPVTFLTQIHRNYYSCGIRIRAAKGVKLAKDVGFTHPAILNLNFTANIILEDLYFEGLCFDLNALLVNGVTAGDDLVRIGSCHNIYVVRCKFYNCGDTGLRIFTTTKDILARTTSKPLQGVNTTEILVENNVFFNVHQISTTTNDYVHGGVSKYILRGNTFENLRGSAKFANRVPGGRMLIAQNNRFLKSNDKGLEIDSYDNCLFEGNEFNDIPNYAIYMVSNNGPAPNPPGSVGTGITGFAYNHFKAIFNHFNNCGSSGSGSCIRIQPDTYEDGFKWNYENVFIGFNSAANVTNPSASFVHIVNGCYRNLSIIKNDVTNFAGQYGIRATFRGSDVAGYCNNIRAEFNNFDMNHASGVAFHFERTSGVEKVNHISIHKNFVTGTCADVLRLGDCKNVDFTDNTADLTAGSFYSTFTNGVEFFKIKDNKMITNSVVGFNLSRVDGLYIEDNYIKTAAGVVAVSIQNTCSDVWYLNNDTPVGTATFRQVQINTRARGEYGREERITGSSAPSSGTWPQGSKVTRTDLSAAGSMGWLYKDSGTYGTLTGVTVTTNGTNNSVTFGGSYSNLPKNSYVILGGDGIKRKVTSINYTTGAGTVDGAVPASMNGAAVAFSAPSTPLALPSVA